MPWLSYNVLCPLLLRVLWRLVTMIENMKGGTLKCWKSLSFSCKTSFRENWFYAAYFRPWRGGKVLDHPVMMVERAQRLSHFNIEMNHPVIEFCMSVNIKVRRFYIKMENSFLRMTYICRFAGQYGKPPILRIGSHGWFFILLFLVSFYTMTTSEAKNYSYN